MDNAKPNTRGADTALKIQKLLKSLIECMSQETLALKSHNRDVAGKMSEEKTRLLLTYQNIASELHKNPDVLKQADADIQKQLISLMGEFETVLKDNMTAIQAGKGAVSRLINRLLTKAREAVGSTGRHYNAKGQLVEHRHRGPINPSQLNEVY